MIMMIILYIIIEYDIIFFVIHTILLSYLS